VRTVPARHDKDDSKQQVQQEAQEELVVEISFFRNKFRTVSARHDKDDRKQQVQQEAQQELVVEMSFFRNKFLSFVTNQHYRNSFRSFPDFKIKETSNQDTSNERLRVLVLSLCR